jgi:hypothetical protein
MPLLIQNSKPPCGCHSGGLGAFLLRARRGLGDAASTGSGVPSWVPIIGPYNENVVLSEQNIAGAADAPDNSPAMQSAITAAIAAGNDPTTVMNLVDGGASAVSIQLLANGAITPAQVATPGTTPLTDDQLTAAFNASAASSTPSLASGLNLLSFLDTYGIWIVLGIAGFFVVKEIS